MAHIAYHLEDRATRASTEPASGLGPDGRVSHNAERRGYIAGLMGWPSLPGTYAEGDRRAYERGYDIGRRARLDEACREQA
jgi:ribosome modulation factor